MHRAPTLELLGRPRTRPVDRLVIHGDPLDFRTLCLRAVPEETRYLVLDLDRTVHLGRNMGELLGWEIVAAKAYGLDRLDEAEARRGPGRFFLDRRRPLALLRYLALGARMWAFPGLFYLLFGKIPAHLELLRRWSFRAFGPEPVAAVQRVPQTTLLHQLAQLPAVELRRLARRVWDRHAGDQVILREDLDWLRARCPGLKVVLASASPQPMLEVAAERLGADDAIYSAVEEHEGWLSAPFQLQPSVLGGVPRRLSGPSHTRINSARTKIENLWARHPALADPSTFSVGISDTGYGEDHCWLGHFTRVVDVNSSAPFPPFVPAGSPLREIHSAAVLTRRERERRAHGDAHAAEPRRSARPATDLVFTARELTERLAGEAEQVERLARDLQARESGIAAARAAVLGQVEALTARIEALVRAFNEAAAGERPGVLARLRDELRANRALRRELARVERPLAEVTCAMTGLLQSSRQLLEGSDRRHRAA